MLAIVQIHEYEIWMLAEVGCFEYPFLVLWLAAILSCLVSYRLLGSDHVKGVLMAMTGSLIVSWFAIAYDTRGFRSVLERKVAMLVIGQMHGYETWKLGEDYFDYPFLVLLACSYFVLFSLLHGLRKGPYKRSVDGNDRIAKRKLVRHRIYDRRGFRSVLERNGYTHTFSSQ